MSSYFGKNIHVSVFGQSHATAIGVTVDGLPAGEAIDQAALSRFLRRRAPGRNALSTPRKEADQAQFLCGLLNDVTCGAPLAAIIQNTNTRSQDYEALKDVPRPGHADLTAQIRYRGFQDVRGGGHFSGRLTAPLCIAGGICLQILERRGIHIGAHIRSIGAIEDSAFDPMGVDCATLEKIQHSDLPVISDDAGEAMQKAVLAAHKEGDSLGGIVECIVMGLPAGIGRALFGGLEGKLAAALFAVPAVKGVEFGEGFGVAQMKGSQNNDPIRMQDGKIVMSSNHAGGILGGISSGMPIVFRAAIKPTASIALSQESVRLSVRQNETLSVIGRHDPCIVPRAVPVIEAVAAIVILDALLDPQG